MNTSTNKKALLILEETALSGETARQLCLRAFSILENDKNHPNINDISKFKIFNESLTELNHRIRETNVKGKARKRFEDKNPDNYDKLPGWRILNQSVQQADRAEIQQTKTVDEQAKSLLPLVKTVLASKGIDIITYDAADKGNTGEIDNTLNTHLQNLSTDIHYDCIVLGGGHGSTNVLSGLEKDFVQNCVLQLNTQKISGDLICLGSCESATHAKYMQTLLNEKETGMVIGYLGDSTNNFAMSAINYQLGVTDEFIDINLYDNETEANAKASALAMLHKNEITTFELSNLAANPTNSHYWAESFSHLFIEGVEEKILEQIPKIAAPPSKTIHILGAHDDSPKTPMNALKSIGRTQHYIDDFTVNNVDSTIQFNKKDIVKKMLATMMGCTDEEVIEELKAENNWDTQLEAEEYLEKMAEEIPTLKLVRFSDNTQDRLTAVNAAIERIVPPQNKIHYISEAMSTPITLEMAQHSLRCEPGKLKEELSRLSPSSKTEMKLKG